LWFSTITKHKVSCSRVFSPCNRDIFSGTVCSWLELAKCCYSLHHWVNNFTRHTCTMSCDAVSRTIVTVNLLQILISLTNHGELTITRAIMGGLWGFFRGFLQHTGFLNAIIRKDFRVASKLVGVEMECKSRASFLSPTLIAVHRTPQPTVQRYKALKVQGTKLSIFDRRRCSWFKPLTRPEPATLSISHHNKRR